VPVRFDEVQEHFIGEDRMKKAWDSHPLCIVCRQVHTKNEVCSYCLAHAGVRNALKQGKIPKKPKSKTKEPVKKDRGNLTQEMRDNFVRLAQEQFQDEGHIEIDDNAEVSYVSPAKGGDNGAYVQAWVWVYNED
jgi:hypothetical protein